MAPGPERTDSLLFKFDNGHVNTVNLDRDSGDDSDGTLLGDEFDDAFVTPTPEAKWKPTQHIAAPQRNVRELSSFSSDNRTLRPGKTVELRDGDFLRITALTQHRVTTEVTLNGFRFRRNRALGGLLEFKRNEVTMLLKFDESDPRDILAQSVEIVELKEVVKVRELVKTNRPFPAMSFRESDLTVMRQSRERSKEQANAYIMAHSRLVCRWKQLLVNKNEGYLERLRFEEADEGYGAEDTQLRCDFRGETEKGGSCPDWLDGEKDFDQRARLNSKNLDPLHFHRRAQSLQGDAMDLTADGVVDLTVDDNTKLNAKRRYTIGDGFCGAGGVSMGAKGAGLRVDWGFDYDPAAMDSYKRNFYRTRCEATAAHEFVTVLKDDFKVDILHLSPPCQPFSPIHVWQGQNDEMNEATFLAVGDIVQKVKPRIVTLEETFGLTRTADMLPWFRNMIEMFTKIGFSIRWKVFNLADFGLPQPRKRLFIFASCPGEILPDFPDRTHCKAADLHLFPHLSRFTTVNDAIARIPRGFPLHNPNQMQRRNKPPYPADLPLRNCVTTQGSMNCHPSGKRNFTPRELACLQGFPLEHQFGHMRTRKQIGNAVPPIVAKVFFEQVTRALRKADGLARLW